MTMITAVVCNAAVTVGGQKHHLLFPCVGAKWPAVAENHGVRSGAPVVEINLRTVFGGHHIGAVHGFVVMRRSRGIAGSGRRSGAGAGGDGGTADQQIAA